MNTSSAVRLITVRKQHTCEWCGESITSGDEAVQLSLHNGSQLITMHAECLAACVEVGFLFSTAREGVEACY